MTKISVIKIKKKNWSVVFINNYIISLSALLNIVSARQEILLCVPTWKKWTIDIAIIVHFISRKMWSWSNNTMWLQKLTFLPMPIFPVTILFHIYTEKKCCFISMKRWGKPSLVCLKIQLSNQYLSALWSLLVSVHFNYFNACNYSFIKCI